jgi:hypothetical protein
MKQGENTWPYLLRTEGEATFGASTVVTIRSSRWPSHEQISD